MFTIHCLRVNAPRTSNLIISRTMSFYRRSFEFFFKRNLLLTNSLSSGGFMAIGDWIQQEIEYQNKKIPKRYDWTRLGKMFIVGTGAGPLHHYYYIYLDRLLPKPTLKNVFLKILGDQGFCAPATILYFFYMNGILEKKTLEQSNKEIKDKFLYVYMGDCLYWPPIQFINFYYLPTHYRVFYVNGATMIFNIFLSFIKHYDQ